MSRKRRNAGPPPSTTFSNPLSRDEESFPGRNDGGGRRRYAYNEEDDWKKDMYGAKDKKSISLKGRNQQTEVLVSNLDKELDDDDILTIFEKLDYGRKILSASLNYDRKGKSTGTAIVTFKSLVAAQECVKECDGTLVDELEMSLKLVGGAPPVQVSSAPKSRGGLFGSAFMDNDDEDEGYSRSGRFARGRTREPRGRTFSTYRRGGRGASRGGGRRGRGGRRGMRDQGVGRRNIKDAKPKSAADLDKDLDAWKRKKTGKPGGRNAKGSKSKEDLDAELENIRKKGAAKKTEETDE
eukprot:CAMPEP_0184501354 /NCGR_PEP_ID=MMETSP0113_2-20130426/47451_1 /TAXON_ID=91329 /ORGANISM="Norrisiella sphaerica, Strain BC52" /LENGTH=295 /DNA_ID=CAMNT_0026890093 /DNA_START=191 /DNA_END=1078 /DNA_ORIENTATION=+